jgi:hypothetical protein
MRDVWFHKLQRESKAELLFEFETLLKGTACFANPRNHPGPRTRSALVLQDFVPHVEHAQGALARLQNLASQLGQQSERVERFRRYLEVSLPSDDHHKNASAQATPEEELASLRQGFAHAEELARVLKTLSRLPYRTFFSFLGTARREVHASRFFNTLTALEFRPEFDRLPHAPMLSLIENQSGVESRRLVSLAFLASFRMLRYLTLIERMTASAERKESAGCIYFVWSVFRSDARAFCARAQRLSGALIAQDFGLSIKGIHARDVGPRFAELLAEAHAFRDLRIALEGVSASLRLEVRRAFEHDLASPSGELSLDRLRNQSLTAVHNLRGAVKNAVLALGASLGIRLDEHGVFDSREDRKSMSERLRRDLWMFAQILRAFSEKAGEVGTLREHWLEPSPFAFVEQFLLYFRSMGYPLIRAADYPRIDPFLSAVETIRETNYVDAERLLAVRDEALHFREYLLELFESVSQREELKAEPFDRKNAATTLRLYLGSS